MSDTETARERVGGIDERHRWPGMQAAGEHSGRPAHFGLHRAALAYCVAIAALVAVAAGSLMLRRRT